MGGTGRAPTANGFRWALRSTRDVDRATGDPPALRKRGNLYLRTLFMQGARAILQPEALAEAQQGAGALTVTKVPLSWR